jgi:hypothetical protein
MQKVATDKPQQLFAWVRQLGTDKVLGLFNFSSTPVTAKLSDALPAGRYREFRGGEATISAGDTVSLPAWGYRLLASEAVLRTKDATAR